MFQMIFKETNPSQRVSSNTRRTIFRDENNELTQQTEEITPFVVMIMLSIMF
jgi:hypothetical protein